jgi:transcriptional regulator with XRE-family HTH domain
MGLNARAIGLKIQQARVAKGMTQGQLAKTLGIDRGSVGRWETGRSVPRQVGLPKIAKVLDQTPDWLMEGSGDFNATTETVEVLRAERRTLKEIREEVRKLTRESKVKVHASSVRLKEEKLTAGRAPTKIKLDKKTLDDIMIAWDMAKPEARLIAALLITGDWSYKLKLMNREVSLDEEVLSILGSVTA